MTEKCANCLKDNEEGSANIAFAVGGGIQEVAFSMKHVPGRAGSYEDAGRGYRMFIPAALPPDPPLELNGDTINLLSEADIALGRLDGVAEFAPNPNLFLTMYVRKEAVMSSQIEGTQATLLDVLKFEAERGEGDTQAEIGEVVSYVAAINYGLSRLAQLPLSLRLIKETHARLMQDSRGSARDPGEFRRIQNWIGSGADITKASFVPPPPNVMLRALYDLEKFMQSDVPMPVLVRGALVHYQFETVHPFLDGNGRLGRLLVTLVLCEKGALKKPMLYLSYYLKRYRSEYYERLMAVRDAGDFEGWIRFFLQAVIDTANHATNIARQIVGLNAAHRRRVASEFARSPQAPALLEWLYDNPITSIRKAAEALGVSTPTATKLVRSFEDLGILVETTGGMRGKLYAYRDYLSILCDDDAAFEASTAVDQALSTRLRGHA